jgi:hypothetical protein
MISYGDHDHRRSPSRCPGPTDHRDRRAWQCHGAAGRRGTQVTVTQPDSEGRRSVTHVRPYRTVTVPGAACGGSGPAAAATAGCGGGRPDRTVPGTVRTGIQSWPGGGRRRLGVQAPSQAGIQVCCSSPGHCHSGLETDLKCFSLRHHFSHGIFRCRAWH